MDKYNEIDLLAIKVLAKEEAINTVNKLNLKGNDKISALCMVYKQILQDKYNIDIKGDYEWLQN